MSLDQKWSNVLTIGHCTPVNEINATWTLRYSLVRIKVGPKITTSTSWPTQPSSLCPLATLCTQQFLHFLF